MLFSITYDCIEFQVKIAITTISGEEHDLTLCLQHEIDPDHCRHKELQSKVRMLLELIYL